MKNKQKLGLIERCFLAGSLALGGAGCIESLTPLQESRLMTLTGMAYDQQMQQQRNDAIRNSGSEVNVYVGEVNEQKKENQKITPATTNDIVYLKDGRTIRGEIIIEKPNHLYIAEGDKNVWGFSKSEIESYINK